MRLKSYIVPAFVMFSLVCGALPASAQEAKKPACSIGPVAKEYGGNTWQLYSCGTENILVVVSEKGNPAFPFVFTVRIGEKGDVAVHGKGTGAEAAAKAAMVDLEKLSSIDVSGLIESTKHASKK